ncbi:MAG: hypothetical protein ACYS8Z_08560 [Planctomycetota bacterium]|jgi:hypothetical protein
MPNEDNPKSEEVGIAGLPRRWGVVVQLVGTFGLAVFLVLYYVLVMEPSEGERYDKLSESITSLEKAVDGQQSQLTPLQASRLDTLFVMAVAPEVSDLIIAELKDNSNAEALATEIEDKLIFHTRLLEGLRRKGGSALSEMMTHKIRNSGISREIAQRAVDEWSNAERQIIANHCREALEFAIKRAAQPK